MATILHRIKAFLYDNALTKDDVNDYVARVSSEESLSVEQIAETAVLRGGADISAPAMTHAVNLWLKEMAYQLCDGFSVNTGWFTAAVHIKGVFDNPKEQFDPKKQHVLFEFQQGAELRKELPSVTVDILGVADAGIYIARTEDMKTGSVNNLLTPGRNLKITGQKIKIAGTEPEVGILFRSRETPDATYPVASDDVVINNPSELMIVIPTDMIADTYTLEITSQFSGNSTRLLNHPRTAVFDKILTVN